MQLTCISQSSIEEQDREEKEIIRLAYRIWAGWSPHWRQHRSHAQVPSLSSSSPSGDPRELLVFSPHWKAKGAGFWCQEERQQEQGGCTRCHPEGRWAVLASISPFCVGQLPGELPVAGEACFPQLIPPGSRCIQGFVSQSILSC